MGPVEVSIRGPYWWPLTSAMEAHCEVTFTAPNLAHDPVVMIPCRTPLSALEPFVVKGLARVARIWSGFGPRDRK